MNETPVRPNRKRAIRTATVLTGLSVAAGTGLVGAGPAAAGTNGSQAEFWDFGSSHVQVCGYNQNGKHVCTPWEYIVQGAHHSAYVYMTGYWWKGWVWIYGYNKSAEEKFYIPGNWSSTNYWPCSSLTRIRE